MLFLTSPVLVIAAVGWNFNDLLFLIAIFLCSYACSFILFPLGTSMPALMLFSYCAGTEIIRSFVEQSWSNLPSLSATLLGIVGVTGCFVFAVVVGEQLSEVGRAVGPGFRNSVVAITLGIVVALSGGGVVGLWMWIEQFSVFIITISSSFAFLWLLAVLYARWSEHTRGQVDTRREFSVTLAAFGTITAALTASGMVSKFVDHYGLRNLTLLVAVIIGSSILSFFFLNVTIFKLLPRKKSAKRQGLLVLTFMLMAFSVCVAVMIAVGTASVMAVVITLPPLSFFVLSWLIAATIAPSKKQWQRFIFLAAILTAFGSVQLGWLGLLTPLVSLVGYCRLFPDYAAFFLICSLGVSRLSSTTSSAAGGLLGWLPPNISALVWLPIPGHDQILVGGFQCDAPLAAKTFHEMQVSAFPSLRATADRALPQIVADRLSDLRTVNDIVSILSATESPLHSLLPQFYQSIDTPHLFEQRTALVKTADTRLPEIARIFPHLRTIANDVKVALKNDRASLREKALINCKDDLNAFEKQLPVWGYEGVAGKRWRDVSQTWRQILDDEIRSQQSQAFQDIRNPFQAGKPLLDKPHLFKGRTNFVDEVQNQILEPSHKTIVLHGPRRCGKTSFLNYLPSLLSSKVIPVSIDLQNEAFTNSDADFFYAVAMLTEAQAKKKGLKISQPVRREDFVADTYPAFATWLNRTSASFGSHHVLLCFDEFEELGTAYEHGRLTTRVFNQLRNLIQHSSLMSFLLAGVRTLDELGPRWSSYFINVYPIEMVYLESDEAKKLLIDPAPDFQLKYDEGIVEKVLMLTRNHPFLIQLLGELLVKQANEARTRIITDPLLNNAVDESLKAGAPYFNNLWNELTGRNRDEVLFGQDLLDAIAKESPIPRYGTSVCQAVLQRLQRFHVIERVAGGYRIEVPLFRQWVLTHAVRES
jgi:hypothetical protein